MKIVRYNTGYTFQHLLFFMENQDNLTKKQRRELKRQQKLERKDQAVKRQKMSRIALWGGVLLFIVALIVGMMQAVKSKDDGSGSSDKGGTVAPITADDQQLGENNLGIEIIEYGDYQCPACAQVHPVVKQVLEKYGDYIGLAFRHFPLRQIHQNGQIASQAVEAAGKQGKYWEMHELLFDRQSDWSKERNPEDLFTQYAGEIGINGEQFKTDLKSNEVKDAVNADYESGVKANVSGTPAFFLNGEKVENAGTLSAWEKLIDPLISAVGSQAEDSSSETDAADESGDQATPSDAAANTNQEESSTNKE